VVPAIEALELLRQGNRRFVARLTDAGAPGRAAITELNPAPEPIAVILGCADSRVSPEVVFDEVPGDLFVVRVAGNIAGPTQVGSVEYGAVKWGARLVVVLGHTDCGAVATTVTELLNPVGALSDNVRAIFDFVRPSVEPLMGVGMTSGREAVESRGVRDNVSNSARILRSSPVLAGLAESEGLMVVGAVYSLETGEVEFFDGVTS